MHSYPEGFNPKIRFYTLDEKSISWIEFSKGFMREVLNNQRNENENFFYSSFCGPSRFLTLNKEDEFDPFGIKNDLGVKRLEISYFNDLQEILIHKLLPSTSTPQKTPSENKKHTADWHIGAFFETFGFDKRIDIKRIKKLQTPEGLTLQCLPSSWIKKPHTFHIEYIPECSAILFTTLNEENLTIIWFEESVNSTILRFKISHDSMDVKCDPNFIYNFSTKDVEILIEGVDSEKPVPDYHFRYFDDEQRRKNAKLLFGKITPYLRGVVLDQLSSRNWLDDPNLQDDKLQLFSVLNIL